MKNVLIFIVLLTFSSSILYAPPSCLRCSNAHHNDMFATTYNEFFEYIKERNDMIKDKYSDIRKNQIKEILIELENKNIILNNIQNLSRDDALTKTEQNFLIDIKKELKGILIDTWGEK